MKNNKKHIIVLYLIILVSVGINIISNRNIIFDDNKIILKNMDESTQVSQLNSQIDTMNTEHYEYKKYIAESKAEIATALTNQNVPTSQDATLETMAENIEKVLVARTSDATATADSIIAGKTAYVNGKIIVGTAKNAVDNILGELTMLVANGKGEKNTSITVPDGITSGYVICCANAFFLPTLSIEGDGISSQTLVASWQAEQGGGGANHIVKIFYCEFNPGKTITANMSASGNNYATSIGILSRANNNL